MSRLVAGVSGVHGEPWRPMVCQRWRPSFVRYLTTYTIASPFSASRAEARHRAFPGIPSYLAGFQVADHFKANFPGHVRASLW